MKRRYLIPEVIQTSAMDCGPAALKALFGGFDHYLSYGRLREACQTDVDGTSIDALEVIAQQLGLDASQSMMPIDLLLLESSACLPALIVVALPDGGTHVVVLWRVHGPWLQIMDPGAGRGWVHRDAFLSMVYRHEQAVPAEAWAEWSQSPEFTAGLRRRMRTLGVQADISGDRARLDAALRLGGALLRAKQLRRGREATAFLQACEARSERIPDGYGSVRACSNDETQVMLRGAVLIAARGPVLEVSASALPDSLARARSEPPPRVWQPVWDALRESGGLQAACGIALLASAVGLVFEALLFRGLFDLARHLQSTAARVGSVVAVLVFLSALLGLTWPTSLGMLRLGRQLEVRLRARLLTKVPRLEDRYFQSRLISDMAFRAHSLQLLRNLPQIAGHALNIAAHLLVTAIAVAWIYPGSAWLVGGAVTASCLVPVLMLPAMGARDLRCREFNAALSSLYLETLLGARAIQAHGGARGILALQSELLAEWSAARLRQQALVVIVTVIHMSITLGFIVALVCRQATATQSPAGLLLLIYWTTSIPLLGQEAAGLVQGLPAIRNTLLRFLELIGAPEVEGADAPHSVRAGGFKIEFDRVSILVGGQTVLNDVSLVVAPGEQVAIVGASGAGKSSLLACLLGWYRPASGAIRIDDEPLSEFRQQQLRQESAWIDPQVHLFGSTLFENLRYGNPPEAALQMVIEDADLAPLLRRSALGLQTQVGEGGTLVSGGEGQRIRAGRAYGRERVRLALLDEPARGLGREQRRGLLQAARHRFAGATLLCVTHDIADTLEFDRVIVIEHGAVIENGTPRELQARDGSRYGDLLAIERQVSCEGWAHQQWRRVRLEGGRLREGVR